MSDPGGPDPDDPALHPRRLRPAPLERAGTEPATARSPLRLRLVLASWGVVFDIAAAIFLLARAAADPTHRSRWLLLAAALGVLLLVTVVDLVVVIRRVRDARRPLDR